MRGWHSVLEQGQTALMLRSYPSLTLGDVSGSVLQIGAETTAAHTGKA